VKHWSRIYVSRSTSEQAKSEANAWLNAPDYGTLRFWLEQAHSAVEAATIEAWLRVRLNEGSERRARGSRRALRGPGGGGCSVAEEGRRTVPGEEFGGEYKGPDLEVAAGRTSRQVERRIEVLKRRRQLPERNTPLKLLTTDELRRALVLVQRSGVLPSGDVRRPEAFLQATPGELEALERWREVCGEPLDHLEAAEELLDRMGEAYGWRSPEAINAALFLQRLERPDKSPWFVAKMAEAVLTFYAELGQHPDEPQHPRVRGAVRRLERLNEIGLQDLAELPGAPEAAAEGPEPRPSTQGTQADTQGRSWWRRLFGGGG
jgi:hypothetical protein